VAARIDVKKAKSMGKAKVVKERSKDWEDINGRKKRKGGMFDSLAEAEVGVGMELDGEKDGIVNKGVAALPLRTQPIASGDEGGSTTQDPADDI
jgi:hypothetical protein